jgi:hypothetical protein
MNPFGSFGDDFYVNMTLNSERPLPSNRESVLDFFERIQKQYPSMRIFYGRDKGDFVLEEDKGQGHYRWSTIDQRRICSGFVNPSSLDDAVAQHRLVLDLAPYMLSVSPLDCEALDLLFGFDFTYRGNHNGLVADALGISTPLEDLADHMGGTVINYEPSLTLALDEDCRVQCRMNIETRTNAFQVRTGEFPEEQLSVYVTARQYGSLDPDSTYVEVLARLARICEEMIEGHVMEHVLRPLAREIAMR